MIEINVSTDGCFISHVSSRNLSTMVRVEENMVTTEIPLPAEIYFLLHKLLCMYFTVFFIFFGACTNL